MSKEKSGFNSFLAGDFDAYLAYRIQVGFTCNKLGWAFAIFDRYIVEKNVSFHDVTPAFFLKFRQDMNRPNDTLNKIFIHLRGFFDYLVRMEKMTQNPLQEIPKLPEPAYIPFIFSPEQIDSLLESIRKNIRRDYKFDFLKDMAVYTGVLLMAQCGLRISEPVRLNLRHYRYDDKTIYIEKTKFNKDRLIPIPYPTATEPENFLSVRKSIIGRADNDHLLAEDLSIGISRSAIYNTFYRAVRQIGLSQPRQSIGNMIFGQVRPHSLRHSLAVNTLKAVKERGRSPQNALPVLAAYMGHTDYRYTMKYLKIADAEHRKALVDFCIFRGKKEKTWI